MLDLSFYAVTALCGYRIMRLLHCVFTTLCGNLVMSLPPMSRVSCIRCVATKPQR